MELACRLQVWPIYPTEFITLFLMSYTEQKLSDFEELFQDLVEEKPSWLQKCAYEPINLVDEIENASQPQDQDGPAGNEPIKPAATAPNNAFFRESPRLCSSLLKEQSTNCDQFQDEDFKLVEQEVPSPEGRACLKEALNEPPEIGLGDLVSFRLSKVMVAIDKLQKTKLKVISEKEAENLSSYSDHSQLVTSSKSKKKGRGRKKPKKNQTKQQEQKYRLVDISGITLRYLQEEPSRMTYKVVSANIFQIVTNGKLIRPEMLENDQKNVKRRVYDCLNVFLATGIITKLKKQAQLVEQDQKLTTLEKKGLVGKLKEMIRLKVLKIIDKEERLTKLFGQYISYEYLSSRNKSAETKPAERIMLPCTIAVVSSKNSFALSGDKKRINFKEGEVERIFREKDCLVPFKFYDMVSKSAIQKSVEVFNAMKVKIRSMPLSDK